MTTAEARELIEGAVPGATRNGPGSPLWADLGAGSGTFTFALAELLGPGARVVAVDRERAALDSLRRGLDRWAGPGPEDAAEEPDRPRIIPAEGDFRDPDSVQELQGLQLDGALFANALHFDGDPGRTLQRFAGRLHPHGRLVVVEYQDRPPNPWVPHPLPTARLRTVAAEAGLTAPRIVGERPSSYGGFLYCAWIGMD